MGSTRTRTGDGGLESPVLVGRFYERWKRRASLNLSPRTVLLYEGGLDLVFSKLGKSLEEFGEQYENGATRDREDLIDEVKAALLELYEIDGYSSSHTLQGYKGIVSFLRINDLEFNERDFNEFRKRKIPERSKHITKASKSEIRELLKVAERYGRTEVSKTRNVALIHCLKDSGLSRSDVVMLDVGDVRPCVEAETEVCQVFQWRTKTGVEQLPHFGVEGLRAIERYLQAREAEGEDLNDSDPLFIYTQDTAENKYGDRLNVGSLTYAIKGLSEKLGEEVRLSPHSFRSYNWTMMELGRMPKNWAALIQGRSIRDSSEAYTLRIDDPRDMEKLAEAYLQAYPEIAVEEQTELNGIKADVEYSKQEAQRFSEWNEELREENEDLRKRLDRLERLLAERLGGL